LADAYLRNFVAMGPRETLPRAGEAIEAALRLDDGLAAAHHSRAILLSRNYDWRGAIAETARAIELAPSFAPALWRRGILLLALGRKQEARAAYEVAEAVDPLAPNMLYNKIQGLFFMERYDEVLELAAKYSDINSRAYYLGRVYGQKGMLP